MITAAEARRELQTVVQLNKQQTSESLNEVVQAAIRQGSNVAKWYPKNDTHVPIAKEILGAAGYTYQVVEPHDQRDKVYIKIVW